jgi:Polyketide cyclase / dehydrase and lipid transport
MTVDVQTEIVIARPLHVVATYAADPTHAPEWYGNIRSVEWVTEPGVRIGAKVRFSARFLGRKARSPWRPPMRGLSSTTLRRA